MKLTFLKQKNNLCGPRRLEHWKSGGCCLVSWAEAPDFGPVCGWSLPLTLYPSIHILFAARSGIHVATESLSDCTSQLVPRWLCSVVHTNVR